MKSPHNQRPDDAARVMTEAFIEQHSRTREAAARARDAREQAVEDSPSSVAAE
jgi:hypothetical protein